VTTSDDHQCHGLDPVVCSISWSAKSRAVSGGQLRGTIQNDILKEYVARGT